MTPASPSPRPKPAPADRPARASHAADWPWLAGLVVAIGATGCSANERIARSADWAEVFTFTVGEGAGAKVRLGPAQLGLYKGVDRAGLRAGVVGSSWDVQDNYDYLWAVYGREYFDGWQDTRPPLTARKHTAATHRFPFSVDRFTPHPNRWMDTLGLEKLADGRANDAYWTQCDLVIGIFGSARIGFNPGELADAVLGHVRLDLYGDDKRPGMTNRKSRAEVQAENPILSDSHTLPIYPNQPPSPDDTPPPRPSP